MELCTHVVANCYSSRFSPLVLGQFTESDPLSVHSIETPQPLTESGEAAGSLPAKASASADRLESGITWKAGKSWISKLSGGRRGGRAHGITVIMPNCALDLDLVPSSGAPGAVLRHILLVAIWL